MRRVLLLLIGLIIGLAVQPAISAIKIIENWEDVNRNVSTCIVKTNEGHYRLFIYHDYMTHGLAGGITAVKIK